jgi:hypothetical protein
MIMSVLRLLSHALVCEGTRVVMWYAKAWGQRRDTD